MNMNLLSFMEHLNLLSSAVCVSPLLTSRTMALVITAQDAPSTARGTIAGQYFTTALRPAGRRFMIASVTQVQRRC